jgi:hypothetical protein
VSTLLGPTPTLHHLLPGTPARDASVRAGAIEERSVPVAREREGRREISGLVSIGSRLVLVETSLSNDPSLMMSFF